MPLPLTVSCFSKIQIGFTFLVPAHLGSPGKRAVKSVCVRVRVCIYCPPSVPDFGGSSKNELRLTCLGTECLAISGMAQVFYWLNALRVTQATGSVTEQKAHWLE